MPRVIVCADVEDPGVPALFDETVDRGLVDDERAASAMLERLARALSEAEVVEHNHGLGRSVPHRANLPSQAAGGGPRCTRTAERRPHESDRLRRPTGTQASRSTSRTISLE